MTPQSPLLRPTTRLLQSQSDLEGMASRRWRTNLCFAHRQSRINVRWFYTCVQGLLLADLLPAALLDGKVDRLPRNVQQPLPPSSRSASASKSSPSASSSALGPDTAQSSPEQSTPSSNSTEPIPAKPAKAKWEHDEIQRLVELKASGLRHRDIAVSLQVPTSTHGVLSNLILTIDSRGGSAEARALLRTSTEGSCTRMSGRTIRLHSRLASARRRTTPRLMSTEVPHLDFSTTSCHQDLSLVSGSG